MDKRYLLIIIIVAVCLLNMFLIAKSSDEIGNAAVNFDDYTFSIPRGFSLYESSEDQVMVGNTSNDFRMYVTTLDSYNAEHKLDQLTNNTNDTVLSKGNVTCGNITVETIYYRHVYNPDKPAINQSVSYFTKFGTPFKITMRGFNYDTDQNETLDDLAFVVNSLRENHKK